MRSLPSAVGDTALLCLAATASAGLRLGVPAELVFDEVYYVSDAISHLDVGVGIGFQAHPPLGTWLLSAGIAAVGRTPVGWRIAPLVLGVLAVVVLHRLALRVLPAGPLRRPGAAAVAALLLLDGSWFVLSRAAMLDGPVTTAVLATVAAAVATADDPDDRIRWWLVTGALAGAATGIKWSGALGLLVAAAAWLLRRRAAGGRAVPRPVAVAALALACAMTYLATWVPFALHRDDVPLSSCPTEAAPCAESGGVAGIAAQHRSLVRYHTSVRFTGGYESDPGLWPLSYEPVTLWRSTCDLPAAPVEDPFQAVSRCPASAVPGEDHVTYVGNPGVWFVFLLLLPVLAVAARAGDLAARIALVGWSVQWVPWLVVTRSAFLQYMAPTVPFLALGTVVAAVAVLQQRPARALLLGTAGAAVVAVPAVLLGASPGLAVLGWAGAPLLAPTAQSATLVPRRGRWAVAAVVVAAAIGFLVMLPAWTVTG